MDEPNDEKLSPFMTCQTCHLRVYEIWAYLEPERSCSSWDRTHQWVIIGKSKAPLLPPPADELIVLSWYRYHGSKEDHELFKRFLKELHST